MEKYRQVCRLKTAKLEEMGIGKEELLKMFDITDLTVGRWYSGLRVPKIEELVTLAMITKTNVEYLLCITNESRAITKYDINIRLKALRQEFGLTQTKLAEMIGTSQRTVIMYEMKGKPSSLNTLMNFSNLFDVSLDYLLGLTDFRNWGAQEKGVFGEYEVGSAFHILNNKYNTNCMLIKNNQGLRIVFPDGKTKAADDKSFEGVRVSPAIISEKKRGEDFNDD